eukprot:SAG11_NODE_9206_length_933_cov_1.280576_2_plen_72_part_01
MVPEPAGKTKAGKESWEGKDAAGKTKPLALNPPSFAALWKLHLHPLGKMQPARPKLRKGRCSRQDQSCERED